MRDGGRREEKAEQEKAKPGANGKSAPKVKRIIWLAT